jgi:2-polyprenyl-3-methyl-5-hydroxy-6-metoxy-1,4-benzoquinol methylase
MRQLVDKTRDPVYQSMVELREETGFARLGLMNNKVWHDDPKRLLFTMARYKFVAKMLDGQAKVLEVGCGDAFCSRIVRQSVGSLLVTDFDPLFIADAQERMTPRWPIEARVHDTLKGPVEGCFDAAYALDVLEHIPQDLEDQFIRNIAASLADNGILIIGIPSLESQEYASETSRAGHVNCKTGSDLKSLMERHFNVVFLFSMNDEIVHTGFTRLAHYVFTVCVSPRLR